MSGFVRTTLAFRTIPGFGVWGLGVLGSGFKTQGAGFGDERVAERARKSEKDPYTAHSQDMGFASTTRALQNLTYRGNLLKSNRRHLQ